MFSFKAHTNVTDLIAAVNISTGLNVISHCSVTPLKTVQSAIQLAER